MNRLTLGWILVAALTSASGIAHAQGAQGGSSARASRIGAERQRLRTELDRLNAEIDALKRDNRGIRDDYRLRSKLADAEALARRLTEIDARTSGAAPSSTAGQHDPAMSFPPAPEAKPSDDRAVLEAKADILADQAHRVTTQADVLAGRVTDLRGRNELRRRAGQLERDPFSPLEQAKRRLTTSGPTLAAGTAASFGSNPGNSKEGVRDTNTAGPAATPSVGTTAPGGTAPGTAPPTTSGSMGSGVVAGSGTGAPAATTSAPAVPGGAISAPVGMTPVSQTAAPMSATAGFVNKAQPSLLPPQLPDNPGSVAIQFRGILDASTLAEIRRLESAGSPAGNLAAMEWALSALRARAAQLSKSAAALRNNAQTTR